MLEEFISTTTRIPRGTGVAICHPDQPHFSKNLCKVCYQLNRKPKMSYYKRKNAGVCVICEGVVVEGKTRCQQHLDENRLQGAAKRAADPGLATRIYKNNSAKRKAIGMCLSCKNPTVQGQTMCEKHRQNARERTTRHVYKITSEELALLRESKNCGLCGVEFSGLKLEPYAQVIDHDHVTGKIRSVIHQKCNIAIGMFNENIELLQQAINYLKRFKFEEDSCQ